MSRRIQDPLTLYGVNGLKPTILEMERRGHTLDEICESTSIYLNVNNFNNNGPMMVAVGTPKGGVGKSTTAINLAHAFGRAGLKTGLIDLDFNDANDALYVYEDAGLILDSSGNVIFGNHGNSIDVIFGRKVKGQRALQRKTLEEVGIQSKSRPNVVYFLSEQLGDSLGERGNSTVALQKAQNTILKEARKLEDFNVVVLDFPAGTPMHLNTYMNCDERAYVVDFKNEASFSGLQNVAKLSAKKKMTGDNFLVVNFIPEYGNREGIENMLNKISLSLGKVIQRLGDDFYLREAKELVPKTNEILKNLGLEKLAFNGSPAFLRYMQEVEDASNMGNPYLATLSKKELRSIGYSRQQFNLATNMVKSHMNGGGK